MSAASASLELQKAIYAALSGDAAVQAALAVPKSLVSELPGTKVMLFDLVPAVIRDAYTAGNQPTYATFGEGGTTYTLYGEPADEEDEVEQATQVELADHTIAVHVYSQQVGLVEAKTIADVIRRAIAANLIASESAGQNPLPTNRLLRIDPSRDLAERLQDGFTSHVALVMTAQTQSRA